VLAAWLVVARVRCVASEYKRFDVGQAEQQLGERSLELDPIWGERHQVEKPHGMAEGLAG
jgi:hypothetical protein